jgi:hypothetical protein
MKRKQHSLATKSEPKKKAAKKGSTSAGFDNTLDFKSLDMRAHPELYRVGRGEQGVLSVEPYKSEILPHWRFRTPDIAAESADAILALYNDYKQQHDFVGMPHTCGVRVVRVRCGACVCACVRVRWLSVQGTGMDMSRKFLQMGFTRSRRYANHRSGRKYSSHDKAGNDHSKPHTHDTHTTHTTRTRHTLTGW